ncbi:hypothetical protein [Agromyces seonyuensis]|uniref:Uncharacterized protein n=1 Tax=Agromyces seonyuensis TaxID=2662446 RepID=A0A6I4P3E5_9MICO|nr:hypothetical protein [Agromyces seonyuensis]MWB97847.1 hypothetical protein [Agromyces seonyuensis]
MDTDTSSASETPRERSRLARLGRIALRAAGIIGAVFVLLACWAELGAPIFVGR